MQKLRDSLSWNFRGEVSAILDIVLATLRQATDDASGVREALAQALPSHCSAVLQSLRFAASQANTMHLGDDEMRSPSTKKNNESIVLGKAHVGIRLLFNQTFILEFWEPAWPLNYILVTILDLEA